MMVSDPDGPLRFLPLAELTQLHTNKVAISCKVPKQTLRQAVKQTAANHAVKQSDHSQSGQTQNEFSQLLVNKTSNSYHLNISFYQLSILEGALHCTTTLVSSATICTTLHYYTSE
jgi:hypothetical protein